jgi:trk system potassium uptake protein TrkH
MNNRAVFHLVAFLLLFIALAMAVSWVVSALTGDPIAAQKGMALSAAIVCICSLVMWVCTRGPVELSRRDGIGIVTFGWLLTVLAGAIPFVMCNTLTSPVDAVFESVSGFTTTGSSIFTNVEILPKGILFWRAMTHFLGGMGILVLCVAILPFLGVGGMQIYRAEVAGPTKDRLTPRITQTAKLLWGVYILLNAAEAVLLKLGGMGWFDSVCHAFATIATGGFSTKNASIGAYGSVYIECVVIAFMILGATNIVLVYRALRGDVLAFLRDAEFRFFIGLWALACFIVTMDTWGETTLSLTKSVRDSVFNTTSMISTTGFATSDFALWPTTSKYVLIFIVLAGGCVGSTGGGIKQLRVMIGLKAAQRQVRMFMQPQAVIPVKVGRESVESGTVADICAFVLVYLLTFGIGSLLMTYFTPNAEAAISSVAVHLSGCGPGLSVVGPMSNYAAVPEGGKAVLIVCMLLGRLEFYTLLAVLHPSFWRR